LFAFVLNMSQQPKVVPVLACVLAQRQKMPADQQRLIALPLGQFIVGAMALQRTLAQVLAALAGDEADGVGSAISNN